MGAERHAPAPSIFVTTCAGVSAEAINMSPETTESDAAACTQRLRIATAAASELGEKWRAWYRELSHVTQYLNQVQEFAHEVHSNSSVPSTATHSLRYVTCILPTPNQYESEFSLPGVNV